MSKIVQICSVKPGSWVFIDGKLWYLKYHASFGGFAVCYHRKHENVLRPWTKVTVASMSDKVTTEGWV